MKKPKTRIFPSQACSNSDHLIVVGLTGGIGSGKSSVAALFSKYNIPIIDADQVTRELMAPGGSAYSQLKTWLGSEYFEKNGEVNRRMLRTLVFNDADNLATLEGIIHPKVSLAFKDKLTLLKSQQHPYVIVEIPLLNESHKENLVDRVIVVDCAVATQIARSSERDQSSVEDIKKIVAQQQSRESRLALADNVINNDGSLKDLAKQVSVLHKELLDRAKSDNDR